MAALAAPERRTGHLSPSLPRGTGTIWGRPQHICAPPPHVSAVIPHSRLLVDSRCLQVRAALRRNLTMKSAPYGGYRVIEPQPPTINNSPGTENFLSLDFSPTPLQVFARPADPTDQLVDLQSWSSRPRRRASRPTSIRPRSTSSFRASLATTASSPRAMRPPAVCCLSALLSTVLSRHLPRASDAWRPSCAESRCVPMLLLADARVNAARQPHRQPRRRLK